MAPAAAPPGGANSRGAFIEAILETRRLRWPDEAACAATARAIAVAPGIGQAFIALHGELGAGKTTFVRHLLRALGVEGRIKSPTYALMEPYLLPALGPDAPGWHFDFYRLDDPQEWEDAGFREIFAGDGLKLAEWPEKAAGRLPPADLRIDIAFGAGRSAAPATPVGDPAGHAPADADDRARDATFTAATALGRALLPP